MAFLHYINNQKQNKFIKHCPPPPCTNPEARGGGGAISDMCIYVKVICASGPWYTGGGGGAMFHRQKITGVPAYNTQNTL